MLGLPALVLIATVVVCDQSHQNQLNENSLRPKDTSYGYVPDDGEITPYKEADDRSWRLFELKERLKSNIRDQLEGPYSYEPPVYGPPFEDGQRPVEPPPTRDEYPEPPINSYIPPSPEIPFDELLPPQGDEIPEVPPPQYLPPKVPSTRSRGAFNPSPPQQTPPLQLEVNEMSCYETPTDGRFRAVLAFKESPPLLPVFEDSSSSDCEVRSESDGRMRLDLAKRDFRRCGVRECSTGGEERLMCLRLRFPAVRRMRLPEDAVLTLQCTKRERVAAHTKHLQFDVAEAPSVRSGGVVARGGGRGTLRSRAVLFRRGIRGDYSEPLLPHSRVPLGDTLMLRTDIEPGDGWTSSRLSSVAMRGGGDQNDELVLLQSDGCRAPQSAVICPRDPVAVSPLTQTLLIRAALFEGMRSGEEVRLSVRMLACLEANDCRATPCSVSGGSPFRPSTPTRTKRQLSEEGPHRHDHQVANSTSVLSFKVFVPSASEQNFEEALEGRPGSSDGRGPKNGPVIRAMIVLSATIVSAAALIFLKTKGGMCRL